MKMKMLDKFGIKVKKLSFEIDGETQYFYSKPITYNLAQYLRNQHDEVIQQLVLIRHCLCEEDGSMTFSEDTPLEVIGDLLPYECISLMATSIANTSGPKARDENTIKKPVN